MFFVRTAAAVTIGVLLAAICYVFVDRSVAWFVHDHFAFSGAWQLGTSISEVLKIFVAAAILGVVLWRLTRRAGRSQTVLLAIAASVVVTAVLKEFFKLACGRTWPETWRENNPSLIGSGAYGFHPFHPGLAYKAFPSGHAAMVFAILSIVWLCYPRWRWWTAFLGAACCAALIGLNYHFVGDVIAGAMLGSITGAWTARLFRLGSTSG